VVGGARVPYLAHGLLPFTLTGIVLGYLLLCRGLKIIHPSTVMCHYGKFMTAGFTMLMSCLRKI